jgi:hypothetical protein
MVGNGGTLDRAKNLCFIHLGIPYLQRRRSANQSTTTTLPCRRESRGQTRKEQATPVSPRPHSLGAREHPLDRQSDLHFART